MQNIVSSEKSEKGFSLVEMAIVLSIFGAVLVAALQLYQAAVVNRQYAQTRETMVIVQGAIREYYSLKGRFPGPADPTAVPGDAAYGVERRRVNVADPCPANIECELASNLRDADSDGNVDQVLIGAVPIMTLLTYSNSRRSSITEIHGRDGFGMKLTYAVSDNMTRGTINEPANPNLGAIDVRDENNQSLTKIESSALFVVLSHGQNQVGATPRNGSTVVEACTYSGAAIPGDPPDAGFSPDTPGIKMDLENCDNTDAIFVSGLRSLADTDDYYDDVIYVTTKASNPLWQKSSNSPDGQMWINNMNLKNVGVGTKDPGEKLHATDNIRAETRAIADKGFCNYLGEPGGVRMCLQPSLIAAEAPDIVVADHSQKCGPGRIATGIQDNKLVCKDLFFSAISFNCPNPGEFVTSFKLQADPAPPHNDTVNATLVPGSVVCQAP